MRIDPRLIGFTASSQTRRCFQRRCLDFLRLAVPSWSVTTPTSSSRAFASSEFLRFVSSLSAWKLRSPHLRSCAYRPVTLRLGPPPYANTTEIPTRIITGLCRHTRSCASATRSTSRLGPLGPSFTCLGLGPSSRLHPSAATSRTGSQTRTSIRPRVFSTPRRFAPRSGSQACFIPLPRPGSSRSGASLLAQPPSLIGRSMPPGRLSGATLTLSRELPRRSGPGFEAFIYARPRSVGRRYSPRPTSLPSSGSSPPGSHFPRMVAGLPTTRRSRRFFHRACVCTLAR
jgi:hypothetical protein